MPRATLIAASATAAGNDGSTRLPNAVAAARTGSPSSSRKAASSVASTRRAGGAGNDRAGGGRRRPARRSDGRRSRPPRPGARRQRSVRTAGDPGFRRRRRGARGMGAAFDHQEAADRAQDRCRRPCAWRAQTGRTGRATACAPIASCRNASGRCALNDPPTRTDLALAGLRCGRRRCAGRRRRRLPRP